MSHSFKNKKKKKKKKIMDEKIVLVWKKKIKILWAKTTEISEVTPEWAPGLQTEESLPRPSRTPLSS